MYRNNNNNADAYYAQQQQTYFVPQAPQQQPTTDYLPISGAKFVPSPQPAPGNAPSHHPEKFAVYADHDGNDCDQQVRAFKLPTRQAVTRNIVRSDARFDHFGDVNTLLNFAEIVSNKTTMVSYIIAKRSALQKLVTNPEDALVCKNPNKATIRYLKQLLDNCGLLADYANWAMATVTSNTILSTFGDDAELVSHSTSTHHHHTVVRRQDREPLMYEMVSSKPPSTSTVHLLPTTSSKKTRPVTTPHAPQAPQQHQQQQIPPAPRVPSPPRVPTGESQQGLQQQLIQQLQQQLQQFQQLQQAQSVFNAPSQQQPLQQQQSHQSVFQPMQQPTSLYPNIPDDSHYTEDELEGLQYAQLEDDDMHSVYSYSATAEDVQHINWDHEEQATYAELERTRQLEEQRFRRESLEKQQQQLEQQRQLERQQQQQLERQQLERQQQQLEQQRRQQQQQQLHLQQQQQVVQPQFVPPAPSPARESQPAPIQQQNGLGYKVCACASPQPKHIRGGRFLPNTMDYRRLNEKSPSKEKWGGKFFQCERCEQVMYNKKE
jgi:hypothetical protein